MPLKQEACAHIANLYATGLDRAAILVAMAPGSGGVEWTQGNWGLWGRTGYSVLDKWVDEVLYPSMSLSAAKRQCDMLSRACARRVQQKRHNQSLFARKSKRGSGTAQKRPERPPTQGTRAWNIERVSELCRQYPLSAIKGYKRATAVAVARLLEGLENDCAVTEQMMEVMDEPVSSRESSPSPQPSSQAVVQMVCAEAVALAAGCHVPVLLPSSKVAEGVWGIVDEHRWSAEEYCKTNTVVSDTGGKLMAKGIAGYQEAMDDDCPYLAFGLVSDALDAEITLKGPTAASAIGNYANCVVRGDVQRRLDWPPDPCDAMDVDECAPVQVPNQPSSWSRAGYCGAKGLLMGGMLPRGPFGRANSGDRARANAVTTAHPSGLLEFDGQPFAQARLRSMAQLAADEVGLDDITGQTAQAVLSEALDMGSPTARRALERFSQVFAFTGQVMSFVAVVQFESGRFRTIRGDIPRVPAHANLLSRGLLAAGEEVAKHEIEVKACQMSGCHGDPLEQIVSLTMTLPTNHIPLESVVMTGITLRSNLWETVDPTSMGLRDGLCVLDYIVQAVMDYRHDVNNPLVAGLDDVSVRRQFDAICNVEAGISVDDIREWLATHQHPIGFYAIDPLTMEVFSHYRVACANPLLLTFVVAHHHCYPVTNRRLRARIFQNQKLEKGAFGFFRSDTDDFVYLEDTPDNVDLIVDEHNEGILTQDVIYTNIDQEHLMYTIAAVHRQIPDQMELAGGKIVSFVHPVTLKLIRNAEEWHERKQVCDYLYGKFKCEEFHFRNQSWSKLGRSLASILVGKLTVSSHACNETYDSFSTVPLVQLLHDVPDGVALDCNRCYTTAMYHNTEPYLVFTAMDEIEPWDGTLHPHAEYYVSCVPLRGVLKGIKLPAQIMAFSLVKWLLDNKFIRRDDVTHHRKARTTHPAGIFCKFIDVCEAMERELPDLRECKAAKQLVNRYAGCLNIRHDKRDMAFMCLDHSEAMCHFVRQRELGRKVSILAANMPHVNLCIIRASECTRRHYDTCPIWNQIVCNSTLLVLQKAVEILKSTKARLCGVKTDALFFDKVKQSEIVLGNNWKWERFRLPQSTWMPNRALFHLSQQVEWTPITKQQFSLDHSCMVDGPGGSGKTYLAMDAVKHTAKRVLCVAFTNTAVDNMRRRLDLDELDDHVCCRTICSVLYSVKKGRLNMADYDVLVIDEISMVGTADMLALMRCAPPVRIVLGDYNQVPPVERYGMSYKFTEKTCFRKWVDCRLIRLAFNAAYGRYDAKTQQMLEHFVATGQLHPMMANKRNDPRLERNMVYTNKTRKEILQRLHDPVIRPGNWVKCPPSKQPVRIGAQVPPGAVKSLHQPGDLVVANYNSMTCSKSSWFKEHKFFHGAFYCIASIAEGGYELVDVECEIEECYVEDGRAVTVHKYQGHDCPQAFNIWELDKMTKELLYTAMSRTTRYEDIYLEYTTRVFRPTKELVICVMPSVAADQHMWTCTEEQLSAHLLSQGPDDVEAAAATLGVAEDTLTYMYRTYCQTPQACLRMLALQEGNPFESVNKRVTPFATENLLKCYQINKNKNYMTVTVGSVRWQFRYNAATHDKVLANLKKLGEDEVRKRYGSLGSWQYKSFTKPRGTFECFRMEVTKVPDRREMESKVDDPGKQFMIPEAERLRERVTLEQFFDTRVWYTRKAVPTLQAIRKGTMVVKWGMFHMAEASRVELVGMIFKSWQQGQGQLFEDMHRDVRMCADLDMECNWQGRGWDADEVAMVVARTANAVALRHGVVIDMDDWRFQDACTRKKLSFHIVCGEQVFEILSDQLSFWKEVTNLLRETHPVYFWHKDVKRSNGTTVKEERSIVDSAIYKSAQPMRCVFSEKKGKGNFLLPKYHCRGKLYKADRVSLQLIEEHLMTADPPLVYSPLSVSVRKLHNRKNRLSIPTQYTPLPADERKRMEHLTLPEGFTLGHADRMPASIRLRRVKAGLCPCCERTHDRDNAVLYCKQSRWLFKCFKPDAIPVDLGPVLCLDEPVRVGPLPGVPWVNRVDAKALVAKGCTVEVKDGYHILWQAEHDKPDSRRMVGKVRR